MTSIDKTTAHEYADTVRNYLGLLTDDEKRIEEITGILINRSYEHFYQFFKRNPERISKTDKTEDGELDRIERLYKKAHSLHSPGLREAALIDARGAVRSYATTKAEQLSTESENKGAIKALSHVLVYGATGRKHIGLSRSYVVSYLAEQQQERQEIWESKPKKGGIQCLN